MRHILLQVSFMGQPTDFHTTILYEYKLKVPVTLQGLDVQSQALREVTFVVC